MSMLYSRDHAFVARFPGEVAMKGAALAGVVLVVASNLSTLTKEPPPIVSDQEVIDSYSYMIGRWASLHQEASEIGGRKFTWNEFVHLAPGKGSWAIPDPNVLYSEAWIYVDATSCTILNIPVFNERRYSVQVVNGWGEVAAEINAHWFPQHPYGKFALCLQRSRIPLAAGVQRISLPNKKSRMLVRVDAGLNAKDALALQRQLTLRTTSSPKIEPLVATIDTLPGIEGFDQTEAILDSEGDSDKESQAQQDHARRVALAAADPKQRAHIETVIRENAVANILAQIPKMGSMTNGWVYPRLMGRYQGDYVMRSIAAITGLWASDGNEAIYFGAGALDGSHVYTQTFLRDALPIKKARYHWSVAIVDGEHYRTVPNSQRRSVIDKRSPLKYDVDGSLTLAFGPDRPANIPESNWLPTPVGEKYTVSYRSSGPAELVDGYYPPAIVSR
jgi:hypothetical protein